MAATLSPGQQVSTVSSNGEMSSIDPTRMDDLVAEAVAAHRGWLGRLRQGLDEAKEEAPLDPWRSVSTRAAYGEALDLPVGLPNRDALIGWIAALTLERVTWSDRVEVEGMRRAVEHEVPPLGKHRWSLQGLLVGAAIHPESGRRAEAARALVYRAEETSSAAQWWLMRRHEAALQLGLESISRLELPTAPGLEARQVSDVVLEATGDLSREVWTRSGMWQDALAAGAGLDALEGWPAQLSSRWLRDVLGKTGLLGGGRLALDSLPTARCGASFVRAFELAGEAQFRATVASQSPVFSLGEHPFDAAPRRHGAVFASLLASPAFLRKHLGLGAVDAKQQARALARTILLTLRMLAIQAAVACSPSDAQAREAHTDLGSRALLTSLPIELTGVVPRANPNAPARLVGALLGATMREELMQRFDVDWFDNPRAHRHLQEIDLGGRLVMDTELAKASGQAASRFLGEPFD